MSAEYSNTIIPAAPGWGVLDFDDDDHTSHAWISVIAWRVGEEGGVVPLTPCSEMNAALREQTDLPLLTPGGTVLWDGAYYDSPEDALAARAKVEERWRVP